MSTKEEGNSKKTREPNYDKDEDHLKEKKDQETSELNKETKIEFFELSRYCDVNVSKVG